mmetsp:Transcript_1993/g.4500  ORF Transcript_1993/g.4500 Transcript_1993/m.4500 type:complete len:134 (-) Transcript_1993:3692-4093(-)
MDWLKANGHPSLLSHDFIQEALDQAIRETCEDAVIVKTIAWSSRDALWLTLGGLKRNGFENMLDFQERVNDPYFIKLYGRNHRILTYNRSKNISEKDLFPLLLSPAMCALEERRRLFSLLSTTRIKSFSGQQL